VIPEWKWEVISMDFIIGFPRTLRQNDSIMVVVDRLTKVAHFIPVKSTFSVNDVVLALRMYLKAEKRQF